LTTIKLEIGANLKDSIAEVVNAVRAGGGIYHGDIGSSVSQAFGIDFSRIIAKDVCVDAVCPRCLQYSGPMKCTIEIKQ